MALIRCSQEFHKWVMEKAFDGNNPVSVVLDRMMAREKEEPGEKPEFKVEVLEDICEKLDRLAIDTGKVKSILEEVTSGKCSVCGSELVVEEEEEGEGESKQVDRGSFICDCGEKIVIEENTEKSLLDGIEWVICPECNSRRRKEYLEK